MALRRAPVSNATALADMLDAALADDWTADQPSLAVLSWRGPGDDDLELAVKQIERHPAEELKVFGPDHECLAVCLSRLEPPAARGTRSARAGAPGPVRVTVAFDEFDEVTIVRHRNGRAERPAVTDGPTADLLRETLVQVRFHN